MNMKVIVGLLVGLIVIQIIGAIIFFNLPTKTADTPAPSVTPELSQSTSTTPAKLSLLSEKPIVKRNEEIPVTVEIDTSERLVEGVDVSLRYDSAFVEPVLVNRVPFVAGRLFTEVPFNTFNSREGVATMSAIMSANQNYRGKGSLAVITFKAKKSGSTIIAIQAESGSTVDSNVVSEGREILGETKNLNVVIE